MSLNSYIWHCCQTPDYKNLFSVLIVKFLLHINQSFQRWRIDEDEAAADHIFTVHAIIINCTIFSLDSGRQLYVVRYIWKVVIVSKNITLIFLMKKYCSKPSDKQGNKHSTVKTMSFCLHVLQSHSIRSSAIKFYHM